VALSYFNALIVVEARRNDTILYSFIYQKNCTLENILYKYKYMHMCACGIIFYERKASAKTREYMQG